MGCRQLPTPAVLHGDTVGPDLPYPAMIRVPIGALDPVVLEGTVVRLVPMERSHLFALADVGLDPSLWALIPTPVTDLDSMRRWLGGGLRARAAILRLGAREEGTFRKHMLTQQGRVRDSVYFSITDEEWPEVKARLG